MSYTRVATITLHLLMIINDVGYAISLKAGNESKTTGVNIYKHNTQTGAHEFYVAQYIEGGFVFARDDYVVKGSPLAFNVTATARVEEYLFGKKVISTYHPVPSQYIRNLQYALKKAMVYFGEENGLYDEATIAAVKAFQRNANLKNVDGIVGEETKEALIPNEGPQSLLQVHRTNFLLTGEMCVASKEEIS